MAVTLDGVIKMQDAASPTLEKIAGVAEGADLKLQNLQKTMDNMGSTKGTASLKTSQTAIKDVGQQAKDTSTVTTLSFAEMQRKVSSATRGMTSDSAKLKAVLEAVEGEYNVDITGKGDIVEMTALVRVLKSELNSLQRKQASAAMRGLGLAGAQAVSSGSAGGGGGILGSIGNAVGGLGGLTAKFAPMIGLAAAAVPVLESVVGVLGAVTASAASAAGGAAIVGAGGIGGFIGSLVMLGPVAISATSQLKEASTALQSYNTAVQTYGAGSSQAAQAKTQLDPFKGPTLQTLKQFQSFKSRFTRLNQGNTDMFLSTMRNQLYTISQKLLPDMAKWSRRAFLGLDKGADNFTRKITSTQFKDSMKIIAKLTQHAEPKVGSILGNIAEVFANIAAAAKPEILHLLKAFSAWTHNLAKDTSNIAATRKAMQPFFKDMHAWWRLLKQTGLLLGTIIGQGRNQGRSLVAGLTQQIVSWRKALEDNPGKLRGWFSEMIDNFQTFSRAAIDMGKTFMRLVNVIKPLTNITAKLIDKLSGLNLGVPGGGSINGLDALIYGSLGYSGLKALGGTKLGGKVLSKVPGLGGLARGASGAGGIAGGISSAQTATGRTMGSSAETVKALSMAGKFGGALPIIGIPILATAGFGLAVNQGANLDPLMTESWKHKNKSEKAATRNEFGMPAHSAFKGFDVTDPRSFKEQAAAARQETTALKKLLDVVRGAHPKNGFTDLLSHIGDLLGGLSGNTGKGGLLGMFARGVSSMWDTVTNSSHNASRTQDKSSGNWVDSLKDIIGWSGKTKKNVSGDMSNTASNVQKSTKSWMDAVGAGMKDLGDQTTAALKQLGINQSVNFRTGSAAPVTTPGSGQKVGIGKARGGYMVPGKGLHDHVPLGNGDVGAPGEWVMNRHTAARMDHMLRPYGTSVAHEIWGESRPHNVPSPANAHRYGGQMFARGGSPNFGGHPSNVVPAVAQAIGSLQGKFPLAVTATTDGSHVSGSYHYSGKAVDLSASPDVMLKAASWIKNSGMYKSLLEGIHNPNLSVSQGAMVSPSFYSSVWAEHADHIHLALQALGAIKGGVAAGGGAAPKLKRELLKGPLGHMLNLGQGHLDKTRAGAQQFLNKKAAKQGGLSADFKVGKAGNVPAEIAKVLFARGLNKIATAGIIGNAYAESSWNPAATGYGGGGLWGFTAAPNSLANLQSYAQSKGTSWTDAGLQTQFLLQHVGSSTLQHLQQAGSAAEAATIFMNEFEHPGIPRLDVRIAGAQKALAMGYARGGKMDWGGWNARGGSFTVHRPTLFGAGENGTETVKVTPKHSGSAKPVTGGAGVSINIEKIEYKRDGDVEKALKKEFDRFARHVSTVGSQDDGSLM